MSQSGLADIIQIPHSSKPSVFALKLYQDGYGTILLGAFETTFDNVEEVTADFTSLIYTGNDAIEEGDWKIVGSVEVPEISKYSRQSRGGKIREGGEVTGVNDGSLHVPEMRVAGCSVAERYLHFLARGGEEKAFYRKNTYAMKAFLAALSSET